MPTSTFTALATTTLGASASSVTFSSIPATYRELVIVVNGSPSTSAYVYAEFNSDTTSANYPFVYMRGNGSTTDSGTGSKDLSYVFTSAPFQIQMQIMDYTATDKHSTVLTRDGNAANQTVARAMRWANTSAITSVKILVGAGNFNAGTTFSLYGIEA